MSSPIPPDPYEALGIDRDADPSTVRSAHRKLALKYHPDKIKDEADRAQGADLFQKIQQAYEILSDPTRRSRYDDKVKLAELRKEALMREPQRRPQVYSVKQTPGSVSSSREFREGTYFEERVPSSSYFDVHERFEEPSPRASARKYDEYERRSSTKSSEKDRKPKGSRWEKPAAGMSFEAAFLLKKKATQAKERVRDKAREREGQAAKAKTRDRDERKDRSEKQSRRAFVVDAGDSDSDTATYVSTTSRAFRPSPRPSRKSEPIRRASPERPRSYREEGYDSYDDKWERQHASVREYISTSGGKRPVLSRAESDAHSYWKSEDRISGKRSDSDSDQRSSVSRSKRGEKEGVRVRPPPLPTYNSAPSNLKHFVEERQPPQSRSNASAATLRERERPQELPPSFHRSQTMPSVRPPRDTAPSKGSKLKHAETQDSGYGSSSPHTPEMPSHSPTRELPRQSSSTKYQIVEPIGQEDISRSHRTILIDEEDRHRRVTSPLRDRERDRERERERERDRDRDRRDRGERVEKVKGANEGRSRSNRVPSSSSPFEGRPPVARVESSRQSQPRSPRDCSPIARHNSGRGTLYAEISNEERDASPYFRRYPAEKVTTSPRIDVNNINHGPYKRRESEEEHDYFPGSRHRQELRQPTMGSRGGSVY